MFEICRLCLSFSSKEMCKLTEQCEVTAKIQTWFSVQILMNEFLPEAICHKCVQKLEEVQYFQKMVIDNQYTLYKLLENKDSLNNFYSSLKANCIKEEVKETFHDKRNDDLNVQNTDNICSNQSETTIKDEAIDIVETNAYSSEDDISLSSIKKTKLNLKNKTNKKRKGKNSEKVDETKANDQRATESIQIQNSFHNTNAFEHKCLTCFELFDSQNYLLNHYNNEHGHKNVKDENVKSDKVLTVMADGNVSYKCDKCDRLLKNKRALNRHVISHIEERPFVCKLCGRTYKTASEILRHSRAHNGLKLECSYSCGYSTVYSGALKEHEKRHRTEYKFKCEKCGKGFQVKTWYIEHQNIHNEVKPFVCNICGLAFHMNRYLTAHRSTVHPQSSNLKRYVCVHCSLPCDSRNTLTEHLKVHGIRSSFLCDMCGKTLSNSMQLKFHKRMHLGIKPYICSTCNKSFAKKTNLSLHERTHTGERAYECERCGKHYTQRSTLLRHNMRHHPEALQKCSKCEKSFTSSHQLSSHVKSCL